MANAVPHPGAIASDPGACTRTYFCVPPPRPQISHTHTEDGRTAMCMRVFISGCAALGRINLTAPWSRHVEVTGSLRPPFLEGLGWRRSEKTKESVGFPRCCAQLTASQT